MGRKPIGQKAMTAAERMRRYRQRPARQLERLTTLFLKTEESARAAFLAWLRKKKFLR